MTDLTCQDLATRIGDLLEVTGTPVQPLDDPAERAAVDYMATRGAAEMYVQQHLSWALGQLGDATAGDPVRDARIALGGWGRLQQLQGGAE